MPELLRFGTVGALGFLIDSGALLTFVALGATPLVGRVASFIAAASVTFVLHHRFTFRASGRPTLQGWSYYVGLTALGALINLSVYLGWILHVGTARAQLILGTALGSLTAMCVNYVLSRLLVFGRVRAGKLG